MKFDTGLKRLLTKTTVGCLLASTIGLAAVAPAIPPTAQDLADLKLLPEGYAIWGLYPCTNVPAGWTNEGGFGVYVNKLGDTTAVCIEENGSNATINPLDPTLVACLVQTTASETDIWLMDWQGRNKRKITKAPITSTCVSSLRWTDQNRLTFEAVLPNTGDTYGCDSIYIMDTLGNISPIKTGITWNSAQGHGYDGVMVVGNRIIIRSMNGRLPTGASTGGIVMAEFNQASPQTQLSNFLLNWGTCGGAFSYITQNGKPTHRGQNNDDHTVYNVGSTDGQNQYYSVQLRSSVGSNFHHWGWAVNDTNWAYVTTRVTSSYPYVVDIHKSKVIRIGFGRQGAAYGSLYIGPLVVDSTKIAISSPTSSTNLALGDTLHIKWKLPKNQVPLQVSISPDNGITWCPIGTTVQPGSASWGNVSWVVTDSLLNSSSQKVNMISGKCKVKIEAVSGTPTLCELSSQFSISYPTLSRSGWTATSSAGTDPASNALDGNIATRWSIGTTPVAGQWFTLDMKSPLTVSSISLSNASSQNGDYLRNYAVYVSNDPVSWGTAVASGIGASDNMTIALSAPATGRYIRIVQTGGTCACWWAIAEINVTGQNAPTTLIRPLQHTAISPALRGATAYYSITGRRIDMQRLRAAGATGAGLYLSRRTGSGVSIVKSTAVVR